MTKKHTRKIAHRRAIDAVFDFFSEPPTRKVAIESRHQQCLFHRSVW